MGNIAFVFSGQGDQYPGMGKELCANIKAAADVFSMCDNLRAGTSMQCFNGREEELKETKNSQPCLYAMELAAAVVLMEQGIKPNAAAGFSLGEVVAAAVSGIFNYETGFKLVCKRGKFMQAASDEFDTSMAAVVKLASDTVIEICNQFKDIYPVNFNCPGQITVSGLSIQMPKFFTAIKDAGGKAIPLKVKGAFHSPFMNEASAAFLEELKNVAIAKNYIPLYSNVTAKPYADDAAQLLSRQICSPVQWEKTILNMISSGINTFIEIGPGKTLINMIRKTDPNVRTYSVSEIPRILAEVIPC